MRDTGLLLSSLRTVPWDFNLNYKLCYLFEIVIIVYSSNGLTNYKKRGANISDDFFFFGCGPFLTVFLEFVKIPHLCFCFLAASTWDPSSLSRNQTLTPSMLESKVPTTGPPGKSLRGLLNIYWDNHLIFLLLTIAGGRRNNHHYAVVLTTSQALI